MYLSCFQAKWSLSRRLIVIMNCSFGHLIPQMCIWGISVYSMTFSYAFSEISEHSTTWFCGIRAVGVVVRGANSQVCNRVKTICVVLGRKLSFSDYVTRATQSSLKDCGDLWWRSLLAETAKDADCALSVFYLCFVVHENIISKKVAALKSSEFKTQPCALTFTFKIWPNILTRWWCLQ